MIFTGEPPKKRGVGSIIGAAFLLLILLSGFSYFSIYFNQVQKYTNAIQEMQEFDRRSNEEIVDFVSVSTAAMDYLNLTLENDGSYQTHLIHFSVSDLVSPPAFYDLDVYINPGEIVTDIPKNNITILEGEEREILIATELGNVFTYTYPRDSKVEGTGESEIARVTIKGLGYPNNPYRWDLVGATENVSGGISDLTSDDGNYVTFRSYFSGNITDITDFVDDDSSNEDGSADIGSHSDFSAQQAGPDSNSDILTEESIGIVFMNTTCIDKESFEGAWPPSGWSETGRWNGESNQAYDGTRSADFDGQGGGRSGDLDTPDLLCANADAIYVDFWYRDQGCENGEFILQYFDGGSWDTIADLGSTGSEYQWLHYQEKITDNQYFTNNFKLRWSAVGIDGGESVYVDYVTVEEESQGPNYELDLEAQWTGVDYTQSSEELAIFMRLENSNSLDATGGYMLVGDGTPDWGATMGTISFWIKWDVVANRPWGQHDDMELRFSGSNLVLDWGSTTTLTSSTTFSPDMWYFIAITWNENSDDLYLYVGDENNAPTVDAFDNNWVSTVSGLGSTETNFLATRGGVDPTNGHGDELRNWNIDRSLAEIQSDYKNEISGSESNLRSYYKLNNNFDDIGPANDDGSGSGSYSFSSDIPFGGSSENLQVDTWYGGAWQNLIAALNSGWNNVSVSSYLDSSTFTIRFKDVTDTGDGTQSSWNIDASLLRLQSTSDKYTAEVEFTGSSNLEDWTELEWKIDSNYDTGTVPTVIQLYNYQQGDYATSGDGYMSYVSDNTPGTDEVNTQTITSNPTNFRDSSGNWRVKIKGEKLSVSQFQMNVDLIFFRSTYPTVGNVIPYDFWMSYSIEAKTADGDPIPYAYASIYGDGTDVLFRDSLTLAPLLNPEWVYLDVDGRYFLDLKSSHGTSETFILRAVIGSVIGEKSINQEAP